MRVIAGEQKGRKLLAPKGEHTRPTAGMVKESVFNIIQTEVFTANVLDMFCGSGQMGIEALSRGALACLFVDNDKAALDTAKKNVALCGLEHKSTLVCADAYRYLRKKAREFDIVFLDPPYSENINRALDMICRFDILKPRGIIVCEAAQETEFAPVLPPYALKGVYRYGKTGVRIIKREAT